MIRDFGNVLKFYGVRHFTGQSISWQNNPDSALVVLTYSQWQIYLKMMDIKTDLVFAVFWH